MFQSQFIFCVLIPSALILFLLICLLQPKKWMSGPWKNPAGSIFTLIFFAHQMITFADLHVLYDNWRWSNYLLLHGFWMSQLIFFHNTILRVLTSKYAHMPFAFLRLFRKLVSFIYSKNSFFQFQHILILFAQMFIYHTGLSTTTNFNFFCLLHKFSYNLPLD